MLGSILRIIFIFRSANIAKRKGRSYRMGALGGVFFGWLAVVYQYIMPAKRIEEEKKMLELSKQEE